MRSQRVYLALGSNESHPDYGDPIAICQQTMDQLAQLDGVQLLCCSSLYRSAPLMLEPPEKQADYINAVVAIETRWSPFALLEKTQTIESIFGRVRRERWGSRTLDIDILLYGEQTITTTVLTLPHYDMCRRPFVLYPLQEIAPQLQLPNGTTVAELIERLPPLIAGDLEKL